MVLAAHSAPLYGFPPEWVGVFHKVIDSNLGVRFFFLISGFLITWLMIKEYDETGKVDIKLFYKRRALRILPVCFTYLFTLWLVSKFTLFEQNGWVWLGNITFTTNFMLDRDWHGVPLPTMHLWSLSVEEQFYLIWPFAFANLGFLKDRRALVWLSAVSLIVAPLARFISGFKLYGADWSWLFSPTSFLNYFDGIAYGCISAVLLTEKKIKFAFFFSGYKTRFFMVCLIMILIPHVLRIYILHSHVFLHYKLFKMANVSFGPTMQAVGFAGLLMQSIILPGWGPYGVLNWPLVRAVGVLSFSIYIWQQLFCSPPELFGMMPNLWWMSFPAALLFAGVTALISYNLLELPFMRLRKMLRPRG